MAGKPSEKEAAARRCCWGGSDNYEWDYERCCERDCEWYRTGNDYERRPGRHHYASRRGLLHSTLETVRAVRCRDGGRAESTPGTAVDGDAAATVFLRRPLGDDRPHGYQKHARLIGSSVWIYRIYGIGDGDRGVEAEVLQLVSCSCPILMRDLISDIMHARRSFLNAAYLYICKVKARRSSIHIRSIHIHTYYTKSSLFPLLPLICITYSHVI